ncbi:MAG: transposase [Akkermansiaceae bacterium]
MTGLRGANYPDIRQMQRKRRQLTAEYKARVATAAHKGETSIQQLAQENDIAPAQVRSWSKDREDQVASLFERKNATDQSAEKQER